MLGMSKDNEEGGDVLEFKKREHNESADQKTQKIVCVPCTFKKLQNEATRFCKTCEDPEPMCETCAEHHTLQQISRNHELSADIQEFFSRFDQLCVEITPSVEEPMCVPCSFQHINVKATHICKICKNPEPLCENCSDHHTLQKLTRNHQMCEDIQQFLKPELNACKVTQSKEEIGCIPCSLVNLHVKATQFCKTCKDPEPLCGNCAKHHILQKITRNHEMCEDILQFPKPDLMTSDIKQPDKTRNCVPCSLQNLQVTATMFCKTCKDPEPLCKICSKHHLLQKMTRNHEMCDDIKQFIFLEENLCCSLYNEEDLGIVCEPCFDLNFVAKATHFCKGCKVPKPICEPCAYHHVQQEINGDHEICGDMRLFPKQNLIIGYVKKPRKSDEERKTPGKPVCTEINSNSLKMVWEKSDENVTYYQVRYKCSNQEEKWKFTETDSGQNCLVVTGLRATTEYTFQVRGVFGDVEGPYSPLSDNIATNKSLATQILGSCKLLKRGHPSIYLLPTEENIKARNENAKTRQLIFGKAPFAPDEKTILLVGATGSGKSTLVDGFVNYILGVNFDDPFRFTAIRLEDEEMKTHNQKEWITVYKIHPTTGSRLNYSLNIIDTPGLGDTRERDDAIVDQIRHMFCSQDDDRVLFIDAVCFFVKASDAPLTTVQKFNLSSIMSLFGKDLQSNTCTLITFADGAEPPVLVSLKELNLPHEMIISFNNSALFAENKDIAKIWKMGYRSFEQFFKRIKNFKGASLCQTKDVLEEREQLKCIKSNIRTKINAGLAKLSELQEKIEIFHKCNSDIENNQCFEYTVEETKQFRIELPPGQHVLNCLHCDVTCHEECHEKCRISDDNDTKRCLAMDNKGNCRICPEKCVWTNHRITPYVFKYVTEKVTKTYSEMEKKYKEARGQRVALEKYIEDMTYCVDDLFEEINSMMNEMNRCKTRLKEIALRPDPLSSVEHIDFMIQSEHEEKQPGHLNRVKMLKELRRMALLDKDVEKLNKNMQDVKEIIKSATGKTYGRHYVTRMKAVGHFS